MTSGHNEKIAEQVVTDDGPRRFGTIDDLPLTEHQKVTVLEWFAMKLWQAQIANGMDYHHKLYDPLYINVKEKTVYSYVHSLGPDGDRKTEYKDLGQIECWLCDELNNYIRSLRDGQ